VDGAKRSREISRLSCRVSLGLSTSAAALPSLLARQTARVFAQVSLAKPTDARAERFCKGVVVEMAFLGALPVHEIELLELAVRNPALECHKGNPRIRTEHDAGTRSS
jgi:hypothetical protein